MGRRPAASKMEEMARTPKATHPSSETVSEGRIQEKSSKSSSHSRKRPNPTNAVVRRSSRIRNTPTPVQNSNRNIEPVTEDLTISDSEMEDELPLEEEHFDEPQNPKMSNQEKKKRPVFSKSPEMRYKSLYINAQKKNEELTNKVSELSLKLDVALAKLEGFEKGTFAIGGVMEKMKDLIMVSALSKANEKGVDASS